jgi:hypothetical protein
MWIPLRSIVAHRWPSSGNSRPVHQPRERAEQVPVTNVIVRTRKRKHSFWVCRSPACEKVPVGASAANARTARRAQTTEAAGVSWAGGSERLASGSSSAATPATVGRVDVTSFGSADRPDRGSETMAARLRAVHEFVSPGGSDRSLVRARVVPLGPAPTAEISGPRDSGRSTAGSRHATPGLGRDKPPVQTIRRCFGSAPRAHAGVPGLLSLLVGRRPRMFARHVYLDVVGSDSVGFANPSR